MAWSITDTGIKYREPGLLSTPANFSATPALLDLEREQWRVAKEAADYLIKHKVVGHSSSSTATFTVTLSGTAAAAGHPNGDTITVTVTSVAQ